MASSELRAGPGLLNTVAGALLCMSRAAADSMWHVRGIACRQPAEHCMLILLIRMHVHLLSDTAPACRSPLVSSAFAGYGFMQQALNRRMV